MQIPTLETERLRLRPWKPEDAEFYHATISSDPDVMKTLPGGVPRPRSAADESIMKFMAHWQEYGLGLWAIELKQDSTFMGHGGLMRFIADGESEIEVAYGFGKAFWGKGYATEAARASLRYGFEVVNAPHILAVAVPENRASLHVMEKCGMCFWKQVNTYDMVLPCYRITRAEFNALSS